MSQTYWAAYVRDVLRKREWCRGVDEEGVTRYGMRLGDQFWWPTIATGEVKVIE